MTCSLVGVTITVITKHRIYRHFQRKLVETYVPNSNCAHCSVHGAYILDQIAGISMVAFVYVDVLSNPKLHVIFVIVCVISFMLTFILQAILYRKISNTKRSPAPVKGIFRIRVVFAILGPVLAYVSADKYGPFPFEAEKRRLLLKEAEVRIGPHEPEIMKHILPEPDKEIKPYPFRVTEDKLIGRSLSGKYLVNLTDREWGIFRDDYQKGYVERIPRDELSRLDSEKLKTAVSKLYSTDLSAWKAQFFAVAQTVAVTFLAVGDMLIGFDLLASL